MKRESDKFITIVRSTKLLFQQLIEQGDSKSAMCKDQPNSTINQRSNQHLWNTAQQQNAHSPQVPTEHLPRQTTSWNTNQTSTHLKEFKLYKMCLITTKSN